MMRWHDFPARLSEALGERSQGWLARRMGVSQVAVSYWMSGRNTPPIYRVEQIATALEVSPGWLAYGEGMMREPGRTGIPTATGGRHG